MSMYAIKDLSSAPSNLRGWSYLASKQLQLEHRRTWVGSAWIVLAFALTSAGIGALMAQLQGRPLTEHVPYVMFGFAAWNFISSAVTGGTNVMVNAKPYLLQMRVSRSVFVLSATLRNTYLLFIQLFTAAVVSTFFGWRPDPANLWVVPAIAIYILAAFGTMTVLGLICARIRDLARLIEAVMRMSFFFTPIIWTPGTREMGDGSIIRFMMDWNPFTHVLLAFRDPLLANRLDPINWGVLLALTVLLLLGALITLQTAGRRVTYWL